MCSLISPAKRLEWPLGRLRISRYKGKLRRGRRIYDYSHNNHQRVHHVDALSFWKAASEIRPTTREQRTYGRARPYRFVHACRLGAEGIVSKKVDGTYQSGPRRVWIKVRNPASIAVQRERSEIWNR
jgi:hypothetical protein